jgi:hypothetical protein
MALLARTLSLSDESSKDFVAARSGGNGKSGNGKSGDCGWATVGEIVRVIVREQGTTGTEMDLKGRAPLVDSLGLCRPESFAV